jgi:hypothetical protein
MLEQVDDGGQIQPALAGADVPVLPAGLLLGVAVGLVLTTRGVTSLVPGQSLLGAPNKDQTEDPDEGDQHRGRVRRNPTSEFGIWLPAITTPRTAMTVTASMTRLRDAAL